MNNDLLLLHLLMFNGNVYISACIELKYVSHILL